MIPHQLQRSLTPHLSSWMRGRENLWHHQDRSLLPLEVTRKRNHKCKRNIIDGWIKPNAFLSIGKGTINPNRIRVGWIKPNTFVSIGTFVFPFLFLSVKSRQGTLDIINVTIWDWMRSLLFPLWHSLYRVTLSIPWQSSLSDNQSISRRDEKDQVIPEIPRGLSLFQIM